MKAPQTLEKTVEKPSDRSVQFASLAVRGTGLRTSTETRPPYSQRGELYRAIAGLLNGFFEGLRRFHAHTPEGQQAKYHVQKDFSTSRSAWWFMAFHPINTLGHLPIARSGCDGLRSRALARPRTA